MPAAVPLSERARQAAALLHATEAGGLVRRSVKDMVIEKLGALIATGVLQVGDDLPGERDLAAALSVSRETVRSAVQTLSGAGVLEVSHGTRTRIVSTDLGGLAAVSVGPSRVNRYDIDSVHAARLLVERPVVAEAARRIDEATLGKLASSLAAQERAFQDPIRFLICDREFHVSIYRACGNPLLADFVTDLYTYMLDWRRAAVSRPGAIKHSYEDHLAIAAALRARDPAATAAAFGRHIDRIYATTRSLLDQERRAS